MRSRLTIAIAALVILAAAGAGQQRAEADPAISGYPDSIASLGDSITRAVNSYAFGDRPETAWSTGTNPSVNPIYNRLLALHPPLAGNRYNNAVSGAQMDALNGQAQGAVAQGAELVFVLMGANDVCTSSEASMMPVATFQAEFEAAMATLSGGLPDARVAIITIPDIYNLWSILKDNATARTIWAFAGICQSMLASPLSTDPADVQRRANVRQRNIDFNDVLRDVCLEYVHCRFDDYAGFNTAFTPAHVSTIDYFHPSVAGQALIAQLAWDTGYDLTDATAPTSDSSGTPEPGGVSMAITATDNDAVSGIEFHTGGAWSRYDGPLSISTGTVITWRAVDVNGNVEATHTCRIGTWPWSIGDSDCDGTTSADETVIGTDPGDACGVSAWPPDFDDNGVINTTDVFQVLPPVFGTSVPPTSVRQDLSPDGVINTTDVFRVLPPFLGGSCTP